MRLLRLKAQGFRAFRSAIDVDLDADVVVLSGPNGQGKTSFLDAILWALSGSILRFKGDRDSVVSLYAKTGEAEVELVLKLADDAVTVRRSWDGEAERLHLMIGADKISGREAATELSRLLGSVEPATDSGYASPSVHTAITRGIYLQQDLVREFLEADDEASRYDNLSHLFGASRVVDLQRELERQKALWSRAVNEDKRRSESAAAEYRSLVAKAEALDATDQSEDAQALWTAWFEEVSTVREIDDISDTATSSEAPVALDRALRLLQGDRRSAERRLAVTEELIADVYGIVPMEPHAVESALSNVQTGEAELLRLSEHLEAGEKALASARAEAVRQHDDAQELALLAKIALRHLGEACPVCQQDYPRGSTIERLTQVAEGTPDAPHLPDVSQVEALRVDVRRATEAVAHAHREHQSAVEHVRLIERTKERLRKDGFEDVSEAPTSEWHALLANERDALINDVERLKRLHDEGEQLSLTIARAGEAARRDAVLIERDSAHARWEALKHEVADREATAGLAQDIIEGLRRASETIVARELTRLQPMAQRIYSAIDPHPALRRIDINATMFNRKGRVTASVQDPVTSDASEHPEQVLSSSQLNALALSFFLAFNLGTRGLPLDVLVLDDPLQSLDDINLLGLVDVLRRLCDRRQLIVSTHDSRFSGLLERKLRPTRKDGRTISVSMDSWSREGPQITVRDIARPSELFVVA